VTLNDISATMTYMMWCEEHCSNVSVFKRVHVFNLVLYGCQTWPLTLREEHRFRVYENRMLRRIFGPKRDEVAGGWRKFCN
jgi:hypothetical protein